MDPGKEVKNSLFEEINSKILTDLTTWKDQILLKRYDMEEFIKQFASFYNLSFEH